MYKKLDVVQTLSSIHLLKLFGMLIAVFKMLRKIFIHQITFSIKNVLTYVKINPRTGDEVPTHYFRK